MLMTNFTIAHHFFANASQKTGPDERLRCFSSLLWTLPIWMNKFQHANNMQINLNGVNGWKIVTQYCVLVFGCTLRVHLD